MNKRSKYITNLIIIITTIGLNISTTIAETTDELVKDLLPIEQYTTPDSNNAENAIKAYNDLPNMSLTQLISSVISTLLGWTMIITIVAIVVAGVFFLTARGNDEEIAKAKKIIVSLLIGLLLMASAYGIIVGLSKFNFLQAV